MSFSSCPDPIPGDSESCQAVETVIVPRMRDIGGMTVGRVLPSTHKQMIGPFIFFDQMGPVTFGAQEAQDVRPHPHIGLSTVTYLFDGTMVHRDSLGTNITIAPGAVNLMTAGKGIVHSERHDLEVKTQGGTLFGIQSWIALPKALEETDPDFGHTPSDELPIVTDTGVWARIVAGTAFGATSSVETASPTLYAELRLKAGQSAPIDAGYHDRALYILEGEVEVDGARFEAGRMAVLVTSVATSVKALSDARLMLLGGEPLEGPRYIWWNFVSSDLDRLEQAKAEWKSAKFDLIPGDADEFIPLPEDRPGQPIPQRPRT